MLVMYGERIVEVLGEARGERREHGELHAVRARDMAINIARSMTHPFIHRVVARSVTDDLARSIEGVDTG